METATSTPQLSLNSHSLRGSFTLATTRRTANSVLASSDTTRLTLSSPVAAMTTSQPSMPASSSEASSQASACTHSARSTDSGAMFASSRSMSITWCLFSTSSSAIERPTAPAPAIAIRIALSPPAAGRRPPP